MQDLVGTQFGRWTVISPTATGQQRLLCRCRCGVEREVARYSLLRGVSQSCGCIRAERSRIRGTKHGMVSTPEWRIWINIIARCNYPTATGYKHYGGRGIKVCERWQGPSGFSNFFCDMGPRPSAAHTVERKNNELGYHPDNCCWQTQKHQARNRRSNKLITYLGRTQTVVAWAEELDINPYTLYSRLNKLKQSVAKALSNTTCKKNS